MLKAIINFIKMVEKVEKEESSFFKLIRWNAVALWSLDIDQENCAICKNRLVDSCIGCQASEDQNISKQCQRVTGRCNHCFHVHCISDWTKRVNKCPLCNTEWMPMKFD